MGRIGFDGAGYYFDCEDFIRKTSKKTTFFRWFFEFWNDKKYLSIIFFRQIIIKILCILI